MAKREPAVTVDLNEPATAPAPAPVLPDYGAKPAELAPEQRDQGPDLAEQIDRLEGERAQAQQRAMQAEALRQQQAAQVQAWAQQQQFATEQAQYDSVANALVATQGEADAAQAALEQAWAVGDHRGAAEAQRRLTKAEARITTLEGGRDELGRTLEWRRANPQQLQQPQQPQPQTRGNVVEQILAGLPGLTQAERDWVREHPDSVTDERQVLRLRAAYVDAEEQGIRRGSRAYFRFFADRLGYGGDDDDAPTERRAVAVAAPVSRSAPSVSREAKASDRYIDLSPEQREHARIAGVSEIEYGKGLRRLREAKRNGMLQE